MKTTLTTSSESIGNEGNSSVFPSFFILSGLIKSIFDTLNSLFTIQTSDDEFEEGFDEDDFDDDFEEEDDSFDDDDFDDDLDDDLDDKFNEDISEDDVSYFIDDDSIDDGDKGDDEYFYGEYDE